MKPGGPENDGYQIQQNKTSQKKNLPGKKLLTFFDTGNIISVQFVKYIK